MSARSRTICGRMSWIRSASDGHSPGAVSSKFSRLNVAIRTSAIEGLLSRSTLPELNLDSSEFAASNSSPEILSLEHIESSRQTLRRQYPVGLASVGMYRAQES